MALISRNCNELKHLENYAVKNKIDDNVKYIIDCCYSLVNIPKTYKKNPSLLLIQTIIKKPYKKKRFALKENNIYEQHLHSSDGRRNSSNGGNCWIFYD